MIKHVEWGAMVERRTGAPGLGPAPPALPATVPAPAATTAPPAPHPTPDRRPPVARVVAQASGEPGAQRPRDSS